MKRIQQENKISVSYFNVWNGALTFEKVSESQYESMKQSPKIFENLAKHAEFVELKK